MAITSFVIGKEAALDIIHPTLGPITIPLETGFNPRPKTTLLRSIPITNGGQPIDRVVYTGWEIPVESDIANSVIESVVDLLEQGFFGGSPETYFTVTETISYQDGTIRQFRYRNVVFQPEDMGNYRGEEKATQRFVLHAARRQAL